MKLTWTVYPLLFLQIAAIRIGDLPGLPFWQQLVMFVLAGAVWAWSVDVVFRYNLALLEEEANNEDDDEDDE